MNIFDIDIKLEQQIDSIINLKNLIEGIEDGSIVVAPEGTSEYINNLYASYTNPIDVPLEVTTVYFDIENATIEQIYNCFQLALNVEMDLLTNVENDLITKIDSYSYIVKSSGVEVNAAKDEAKRFATKAKSAENRASKLKEILIMIMNKYGNDGKSGNKVYKTDKFNLWTVDKDSVDIDETLYSREDKSHYTTVSFKLRTSDYQAFIDLINENPEVLEDVNLEGLDLDTIKGVPDISKSQLSSRLKQGEVIKGVKFKTSTSLTIR